MTAADRIPVQPVPVPMPAGHRASLKGAIAHVVDGHRDDAELTSRVAEAVTGALVELGYGALLAELDRVRAEVLREADERLCAHPRATAIDSDFMAAADVLRRMAAEPAPAAAGGDLCLTCDEGLDDENIADYCSDACTPGGEGS